MCVALILLINSFYKVYYRLFDICEHILVSALLLATILLLFLPLMFVSLHDSHRPQLTIAFLMLGVVGGLVVVITVVYFYRKCLKKRPALSTTGKPEWKRDVIRSTTSSQCRPLQLPTAPLIGPPGPRHYTMYQATRDVATETDIVFRAINVTEMEAMLENNGRDPSPDYPFNDYSYPEIEEQSPIEEIQTARTARIARVLPLQTRATQRLMDFDIVTNGRSTGSEYPYLV
ncbi:hypothetical protein PRIPAC_92916 [Pristionchus pacificus]|uniref:Uncharacterized protein n=1 Tax=Pristionchus pacificus TaxID=54126 RepID=A0A454Y1T6_PRIPA|nr:hypothetical protein PRIPAC_92916 [Pristionchus pacificus]|eukprot:PDM63074.1 hypothetical protein PRIPAC_50289 [Pristionchus pacificus]